jgi:uncharacterized membrane protein YuzA (DUF378 family)
MKALHMITFILLVIGGLNWLLVGAFDFNLVTTIFGAGVVAKVVYVLVGLSALVEIFTHKKNCTMC